MQGGETSQQNGKQGVEGERVIYMLDSTGSVAMRVVEEAPYQEEISQQISHNVENNSLERLAILNESNNFLRETSKQEF